MSDPPEDDPPLTRFDWIVIAVAVSVGSLGTVPLLVGMILLISWIGIRIETAVRRWIGRPLRSTWRQRCRLRRK